MKKEKAGVFLPALLSLESKIVGVDGRAFVADFEVQMRPAGIARRAHVSDQLADRDYLAATHRNASVHNMCIER